MRVSVPLPFPLQSVLITAPAPRHPGMDVGPPVASDSPPSLQYMLSRMCAALEGAERMPNLPFLFVLSSLSVSLAPPSAPSATPDTSAPLLSTFPAPLFFSSLPHAELRVLGVTGLSKPL